MTKQMNIDFTGILSQGLLIFAASLGTVVLVYGAIQGLKKLFS